MNTWEERFPRLWAVGERVSVLVVGGLLFYLFSALVITLPAALVGLFAAVALLVRPGVPGDTIIRFWKGFRRSFGRALFLGLIDLVLCTILWVDFRFFWAMGLPAARVGAFIFASLGLVLAMANVYAWPLLAWYPQPLGKLLRRSLLLAAVHPFFALGALACCLVGWILLWLLPGLFKGLLVLLGPAGGALIFGLFAWQAMKRYAGPDDEFE